MSDAATLGRQIRHYRNRAGITLDELGARVGIAGSQLSIIENGKREIKLGMLTAIAEALAVTVPQLLDSTPPNERAAKELELERAQSTALYASLGLPKIKAGKSMPDDTLDALLGMHRELVARERHKIATPEEARRANTELREHMRTLDNYRQDLEDVAQELSDRVGHISGALTHREVSLMAGTLGFTLVHVDDLPDSARSITDLANGRIYLPPASIPGGHGLRSMAIQAMAHRVLGHTVPNTYAEFLQQRLDINYVAAAVLMPGRQAVEFLQRAKNDRNIAVEDFRDAFGVTHEAAALRFTNLATHHLDLTVHFLRVGDDGAVYKAYENDGLRLPVDVTGSVEGQHVCRKWSARVALGRVNRTTEYYQYTDTPEGTYWESTQTGTGTGDDFSITVGVPFDSAKWFRGRDTTERKKSFCPDPECCSTPDAELRTKWAGQAWTSARMHAHILSPLPSGTFPGVDDRDVFEFLERHN